MKKIFAIVAMAVACLSANAQQQAAGTFSIMPRVGMGYSNVSNIEYKDLLYEFSSSKTIYKGSNYVDILGGVECKYQISDLFGVSLGLDYTLAKNTDEHVKYSAESIKNIVSNSDEVKGDWEFNPEVSVLNIPILAHFNIGNHFGAELGIQPGFVTSAKLGMDNGSDLKFKDECNTFQFGIPVGISWTFNSPIVLDLRYTIPCTKLNKSDCSFNYSNKDTKINTVMLTVGYRIDM